MNFNLICEMKLYIIRVLTECCFLHVTSLEGIEHLFQGRRWRSQSKTEVKIYARVWRLSGAVNNWSAHSEWRDGRLV